MKGMGGLFPQELIDHLNRLVKGAFFRNPQTLADMGQDIYSWSNPVVRAMLLASEEGDALARKLIRCGVGLDLPHHDLPPPLVLAIELMGCQPSGRELDLVRLLLASGASACLDNPHHQWQPLHAFHEARRQLQDEDRLCGELVGLLLDAGADPARPGWQGETALHGASAVFVRHLLHHGIPADMRGRDGSTPLMSMMDEGKRAWEPAMLLVEAGADIHARDREGFSVMFYAVFGNQPRLVRFLLSRGALPESGHPSHPLFHVALHRCPSVLALLLGKGCDPGLDDKHRDPLGWSDCGAPHTFGRGVCQKHQSRQTLEKRLNRVLGIHQARKLEKSLPGACSGTRCRKRL